MPMYEYTCKRGHSHDELHKYPPPEKVKCDKCRCNAHKQVPMPQKTAGRWGDTGGKYIPALGKTLTPYQAAQEAKKRGLVHESDLPSGYIDSKLNAEWDDARSHEKTMAKFQDLKTQHGDASKAWAETFSVDEMKKSGTLKEDVANG
jgi:hypothetical protein